MKSVSTPAIVALLTASIGLGAVAPALAQTAPTPPAPPAAEQPADPDAAAPAAGAFHRGPRGGGFGDLLGFGRGAEGVEIALVRLSYAIDLTDEQQTLFETLKTDALAAAQTFETTIEGLRPADPAAAETTTATAPDLTKRLENRIAMHKAQLAALEAVQPALSAFYDSLTDEQKSELMPSRDDRGGRFGHRDGGSGMGGHGPRGGERPGFKG